MIDIKTIKCPQCGSTYVGAILSSNKYKCDMCGSTFLVDDGKVNSREDDINIVQIDNVFSKEQFLRKALININKKDTPPDVFDSQFGSVREIDHQIYKLTEKLTANYQVCIGYDHQEAYIAVEEYMNKETGKFKKREVTKYKTVTDWTAVNGEYSNTLTSLVENGNVPFDSINFMVTVMEDEIEQTELPLEDISDITLAETTIQTAQQQNDSSLRGLIEESLKGDHIKDLYYQVNDRETKTQTIYLASEYQIDFDYKGETYSQNAFPFGRMEIAKTPLPSAKSDRDKAVWEKLKPLHIANTMLLSLAIVMMIVLAVNGVALGTIFTILVVAVVYFVAVAVINKIVDKNISKMFSKEKAMQLNNKLVELGQNEYNGNYGIVDGEVCRIEL